MLYVIKGMIKKEGLNLMGYGQLFFGLPWVS